jgi:hypothetical protein
VDIKACEQVSQEQLVITAQKTLLNPVLFCTFVAPLKIIDNLS